MIIKNPVLRGFNPDPSICRAGDDYYIATSTFEWFPGVQIHHSKDLVNWHLVAHPLNELKYLDMKGNPNSGGIWAPVCGKIVKIILLHVIRLMACGATLLSLMAPVSMHRCSMIMTAENIS